MAELAVSSPTTRPRERENQRVAIVAPSTSAVRPVPAPSTTPQSSTRCQTRVIASEARSPEAIRAIAVSGPARASTASTEY